MPNQITQPQDPAQMDARIRAMIVQLLVGGGPVPDFAKPAAGIPVLPGKISRGLLPGSDRAQRGGVRPFPLFR